MKIENNSGYEIEYDEEYEGEDNPMIFIYNDWGSCFTFEFDNKEQIDQLIKILELAKEGFTE